MQSTHTVEYFKMELGEAPRIKYRGTVMPIGGGYSLCFPGTDPFDSVMNQVKDAISSSRDLITASVKKGLEYRVYQVNGDNNHRRLRIENKKNSQTSTNFIEAYFNLHEGLLRLPTQNSPPSYLRGSLLR